MNQNQEGGFKVDNGGSSNMNNNKHKGRNDVSNGVYGLGFIGALVFYIQHAATFQEGVIGFLKALVWPAFLIYKLFDFLKM
jgi:hypothetical protein